MASEKTVWLVNHYAQSPGGAGGTRHYQLARALPRFGWNACILAASTELNTGRQRLAPSEDYRLDTIDGIPFLWLLAPTYKGNGLGRIRNMVTFAVRLLNPGPLRALPKPDLILGSSVHPFAVWTAYRLARRYRVPFVFEVRDLWPQTLIDFGLLKESGLPAHLLRRLEGFLYRKACAIVTLLPFACRYIERFGVDQSRIHWIPNGVDISAWEGVIQAQSKDALNLMYFGAFGQANGLETLLLSMHELSRRADRPSNVRLRLIGDGPFKSRLMALADELSLANVTFEEPVAKGQIPRLAAEADVFCFGLIDSPVFRYGISSNKLFDYMSAGRPVIFACSAANNPVMDAGAGFSVPPSNPSALADAIASMARLPPEERQRMGRAGRAYVEQHHDSAVLARKLAGVMNSCLHI
jgi:glycosyltransferase involved in cell wall biosynthesis